MDSFRASIDIAGALAGMDKLEKKVQKKIVRKGLRAGGKVWLAAVKAVAPVQSGNLKRAIKLRAGPRRKGASSITVGARRKDLKVRPGDQAFYPASVEYGHKIGHRGGAIRRLVRALGGANKVAAHPFFRPAFDASKDQAAQTAIDTMKEEIETSD